MRWLKNAGFTGGSITLGAICPPSDCAPCAGDASRYLPCPSRYSVAMTAFLLYAHVLALVTWVVYLWRVFVTRWLPKLCASQASTLCIHGFQIEAWNYHLIQCTYNPHVEAWYSHPIPHNAAHLLTLTADVIDVPLVTPSWLAGELEAWSASHLLLPDTRLDKNQSINGLHYI